MKRLILTIGAALLLCSCGSQSDDSAVTGVGMVGSAPSEGGGLATASPQLPTMDNLRGKPQEFPTVYPAPRYPGGHVAFVRIEPKLYTGWKNQVMLKTSDPPPLVANYYKGRMTKDGWTKVYEYENRVFSSTIYQKGGEEVEVRISADPHGGQNLQLLAGPMVKRQPKTIIDY